MELFFCPSVIQVNKRNKRWRSFVDFKIQGALCARVCIYCLGCQLAAFVTMLGLAQLAGPGQTTMTQYIIPAAFIGLLVVPVALFDLIVFSNRFTGPIYGLKQRLNSLVNEGKIEKVHFRDGDYYQVLGTQFNQLCDSLEASKSREDSPNNATESNHQVVFTDFPSAPSQTQVNQ